MIAQNLDGDERNSGSDSVRVGTNRTGAVSTVRIAVSSTESTTGVKDVHATNDATTKLGMFAVNTSIKNVDMDTGIARSAGRVVIVQREVGIVDTIETPCSRLPNSFDDLVLRKGMG